PLQAANRARQALAQQDAVGQLGQRIVEGEVVRLGVRLYLRGDVGRRAAVADEGAGMIEDRPPGDAADTADAGGIAIGAAEVAESLRAPGVAHERRPAVGERVAGKEMLQRLA